ncbi:transposase [candidate division KSB1 bacterium]
MEFYHLLNRGVDKRDIFLDDQDRFRFIHDLFEFNDTSPANRNMRRSTQMLDVRRPTFDIGSDVRREPRELLVKVHAFCMMPNHYHLLVSPLVENGVSLFMKKLNGGYAKYFNEKYERTGALFQGKYKSVLVDTDAHFLHIPYYIHFNPLDIEMYEWRERGLKTFNTAQKYLQKYRWSSHLDYLGIKNFPSVTQRDVLLDFFEGEKGYVKSSVKMLKDFSVEDIQDITLE